jgi:hypothetical protein
VFKVDEFGLNYPLMIANPLNTAPYFDISSVGCILKKEFTNLP